MIPFEDLSEKNPRVVGITREALLKWKKVKGAKGYKVYLSTVGPQKGFKLKKTIKKNKASKKGYVSTRIYYQGTGKAIVCRFPDPIG